MKKSCLVLLAALGCAGVAQADENLLGYIKGAETLPAGGQELYQWVTLRNDKGTGKYQALDFKTEYEKGITDRFTASAALRLQSLDTSGILIDGYLPADRKFNLKFSGLELGGKYNYLSPAADDFGLSSQVELTYLTVDPHSGQDKDTLSIEGMLIGQKYLMDARLVWVGNVGIEGTYAKRAEIANLPDGFEWPTDPEMELEVKLGTGFSYRFAPNWSAGAEVLYETEFETEVGQERWSVFAGPSLHYGAKDWWMTATWLPQIRGGKEQFDEQGDFDLHLIEKTKQEVRLKLGYNF